MHPLDVAWAKIQRAEEHVQNLGGEIGRYLAGKSPPYRVIGRHQNHALEYSLVVSVDYSDIPSRFAVMAGETVHALRSSLDNLCHALVVEAGGTPTPRTRFPICSTVEKFAQACHGGSIAGVRSSAEKVIRSVQPYTSGTPNHTVLAVIDEYVTLDTHGKLLMVVAVEISGRKLTFDTDPKSAVASDGKRASPMITGVSPAIRRKVNDQGEVAFTFYFSEPAPALVASADFVVQIAFEKCGQLEFAPVVDILAALIGGTRRTLDLFAGEFAVSS